MSDRGFDHRIARVAGANHGVFTRAMAVRLGATRKMIYDRIESGRWIGEHRGVYILAGSPATWEQRVVAACLACGDTAAASHRTAGTLLQLLDVNAREIEISVAHGRRVRRDGFIVHETIWRPGDIARRGAIRLTAPARTFLDLAPVLPPATLEVALDDALARRLVTIDKMRRSIDAAGPRHGIEVIRTLVAARADGPPPESPLETRFVRFLRERSFPEPVLQYEVSDGRRRAYLDFAWPEVMLAVEVDGFRAHSGRHRWESDRTRLNMLTLLGWRVIHVTARDLNRPDALAMRLWAAFAIPGA